MTQIDRSEGLIGNTGIKAPVRAASLANLTLSGEQTIDGIACVTDDRVLVKNQTTGSENGIYVISTGSWNRSDDFDGSYDCTTGTMVRCVSGTTNANSVWKLDTTGTITIGTSTLTFTAASTGFDGQGIADFIHAATAKTTPVGADEFGIWDSVGGLFKRLSFTNLVAYLSALCSAGWNAATATTATTATTANRTDSGEVTVTAHATTGDIFAAAANSILWDDAGGAITTTAFPAASKAGLVREGRCNGASKFTAGANLEIVGIPSGTTITLADKALFTVRAITTTLHRMTYSVSGTFTATGTGFSSPPSSTANYKIENGFVTLNIPTVSSASSNTASFTITGLPALLQPVSQNFRNVFCNDNGALSLTKDYLLITSSGTITVYKNGVAAGWTASATKGLLNTTLVYNLT